MKTLFSKYDRRPSMSSQNGGEAAVMQAVLAKIEAYDRECSRKAAALANYGKIAMYRFTQN